MMEEKNKWWWVDSHNTINSTRSPWLHSTLSDLDEKTKAMLKLIEEDADSFAQRAEMYYKKRPQLVTMVEDLYRTHRSLAERYDQVKSDSGNRLLSTWASSLSVTKDKTDKILNPVEISYDSYSETYEHDESSDSDVDDPEPEEGSKFNNDDDSGDSEVDDPEPDEVSKFNNEVQEVSSEIVSDEVNKLREELANLKEENKLQVEQLIQKDEEKREAIRQLSSAVDMLKEDNLKLRKMVAAKESPKKQSPLEFHKPKEVFWKKWFNGSPRTKTSSASLELIASK